MIHINGTLPYCAGDLLQKSYDLLSDESFAYKRCFALANAILGIAMTILETAIALSIHLGLGILRMARRQSFIEAFEEVGSTLESAALTLLVIAKASVLMVLSIDKAKAYLSDTLDTSKKEGGSVAEEETSSQGKAPNAAGAVLSQSFERSADLESIRTSVEQHCVHGLEGHVSQEENGSIVSDIDLSPIPRTESDRSAAYLETNPENFFSPMQGRSCEEGSFDEEIEDEDTLRRISHMRKMNIIDSLLELSQVWPTPSAVLNSPCMPYLFCDCSPKRH